MNAAKTSEKSDIDLMNDPQAKREADRAQANRDELTERIAQAIHHDGTIEPLKGLHFNRASSPSPCVHSVSIPAFCAIAFGGHSVPSLRAAKKFFWSAIASLSVRPDALSAGYGRTTDCQPNSGSVQGATVL
jgi:hypothetical protein